METTISRYNWLNAVALLLVLPTVYFITISVLKFVFGVHEPFDAMAPVLEQWGIKEFPGWNINLLILFGPVAALGIGLLQVLHINWQIAKEQLEFRITVERKKFPIAIVIISGLVLATLFVYLLGENWNHYSAL